MRAVVTAASGPDVSALRPAAVLAAELADLETRQDVFDETARRAADSVVERREDAQRISALKQAGFAGPGWDALAAELFRYGYAVVIAWLGTLEMFTQCARKGCAVGEPPLFWNEQDREDLATDTVNQAISNFRATLQAGKWSAIRAHGASVKTYFIGACVFAFPNYYRDWQRATQRWARGVQSIASLADDRERWSEDPDEVAILRLQVTAGITVLPDERTRKAVLMTGLGYSQVEIAAVLDTSPRAVEGLLHRHRTRVAQGEYAWDGGLDD